MDDCTSAIPLFMCFLVIKLILLPFLVTLFYRQCFKLATCCKLLWLRCDRPFYTHYSSTAILVPGVVAVQVATAVDSVNCKVGGVFPVTFQLLLHWSVQVPRANFMHI